jgi:putative membrane protein
VKANFSEIQDYFKLEGMKMIGGFGMGFMGIFWVGIIILVIALVWPHIKRAEEPGESRNSPLDILKERYARGEINKEEFEERRKGLVSG